MGLKTRISDYWYLHGHNAGKHALIIAVVATAAMVMAALLAG